MLNSKILLNRSNKRKSKIALKPLTITILDILVIIVIVLFLKFYYKVHPFVKKRVGNITFFLVQERHIKQIYFKIILKNQSREDIKLIGDVIANFYLISHNNTLIFQKTFYNSKKILKKRQRLTFFTHYFKKSKKYNFADAAFYYNGKEYELRLKIK